MIDPVLTVADVCRVLKCSRATFYDARPALVAAGALVELRPALDRRPRYRGEVFAAWLSDAGQVKAARATLRAVAAR